MNPTWKDWIINNWLIILWCISWSALGIGLSLFNDRDNNSEVAKRISHYITYFPFVWFLASLLASAYSGILTSATFEHYAMAAAIALSTSFAGDRLAGLLKFDK